MRSWLSPELEHRKDDRLMRVALNPWKHSHRKVEPLPGKLATRRVSEEYCRIPR
jgi:hypothetical protein